MRMIFFASDKEHELKLAKAFKAGAELNSESVEICINGDNDASGAYDLAIINGVKNAWRAEHLKSAGVPFLFFDKGYNRKWNVKNPEWWRVAVNHHQPTRYLHLLSFDNKRARQQGWKAKPWRESGTHILLAGASAKYHQMYGLPDPTAWAEDVIQAVKQLSDRPIIYRPKPSWKEAKAVDGAEFKGRASYNIYDDLKGAHAMITHGSGACLEALLAGVPAVVLGPGITSTISSMSLDEIETPQLGAEQDRNRLLANLAHCQWSLDEIRKGLIWQSLRRMISAEHGL